jgi:DNA-binding response OmpR family regulator
MVDHEFLRQLAERLEDGTTHNPNSRASELKRENIALRTKLQETEYKLADLQEKETRSRELLLSLATQLTPAPYRIVKYLWDRTSASLDDLYQECWDKAVQPESQRTAIKRLSTELQEINCGVWIETNRGVVTLHRPDK